MLHDNFIKVIEDEGEDFKALMKIIEHLNINAKKGRKLLCLVDHIINFYINREEIGSSVRMPIIYFPICEEWAQQLCEEFVSLKISLLYGGGAGLLGNFREYINIPESANKKEIVSLKKQQQFKRNIKYYNEKFNYSYNPLKKCLLYSRYILNEYDLTCRFKGHYHFSCDLMGLSYSEDKAVILLGENEDDLYSAVEENRGNIKFPNIFLFLQKEADGHNAKLCMRLQRSTINEYNDDYDTGIHNVFFFVFSQKPYKLHSIYENKHRLVERLQREKVAETHDYISFTKKEMDYIFERNVHNFNIYDLECDNYEEYEIKKAFDWMLQDIPHEVRFRNELAICFTEESCKKIRYDILELNPEINEEYLDYFLDLVLTNNKYKLQNILSEKINNHQVAIVLDYNINQFYKEQLEQFIKEQCGAIFVKFYTFRNFKVFKEGDIFKNSIDENKILVLSMLNHCTGRNWAIYPNSFDQYHINPEQNVLQINNKIVFDPRFSWYKYRYAEQYKLLLNSDFRYSYLKSAILLPSKPNNVGPEPKDDKDEQDTRARLSEREQQKIIISFGRRQHKTLYEDDFILCQYQERIMICSVSDILNDYDNPTELMIQPLIDFYQPLEIIINREDRKIGKGETLIRGNHRYNLTKEEQKSNREMWKIILEHRVAELGENVVYDEIMKPLLPIERITISRFRQWLEPTDSSILPRSRRMQKRVLEEYLHIEGLYTRILRHRKSKISTNTERKNSIFRIFLTHCLLESNTDDVYKKLSDEVCDYLNIANGDDIKVIIELVKEEALNLKTIKSIKYDKK